MLRYDRPHVTHGVAGLVWINPNDHVSGPLVSDGWDTAVGMPTSRPTRGNHASVEPDHSQPVNWEAYPGRANPKVADGSRANPANDLPEATTQQPQQPAPTDIVGGSVLLIQSPSSTNNRFSMVLFSGLWQTPVRGPAACRRGVPSVRLLMTMTRQPPNEGPPTCYRRRSPRGPATAKHRTRLRDFR